MRLACALALLLVNGSLAEQALRSVGKGASQSTLTVESIERKPDGGRLARAGTATDHKEFALMNTADCLYAISFWLLLYIPLALYYFHFVRWHVEELSDEGRNKKIAKFGESGSEGMAKFTTDLFECHKEIGITFWSCCCPGIRWADTYHKLGIHKFWSGFWIMTGLIAISFIPMATVICWIIVAAVMAYYRQELRKAFKFEDAGGATYVTDCLTYFCCMCCATAQDARHTRVAVMIDHPAIFKWPDTARGNTQEETA